MLLMYHAACEDVNDETAPIHRKHAILGIIPFLLAQLTTPIYTYIHLLHGGNTHGVSGTPEL